MLSKTELAYFKKKLLQIMQEMIQVIELNQPISFEDSGELSSVDNHFADNATDLHERDKQTVLIQNAQHIVKEVNEALERIREGTYGICIDTDEDIPFERLEVLPYAKRTIEAQQKLEREAAPIPDEDQSFSTPQGDQRGDKRIQTVDELQYEHGNSSY
ncbi:TraR/DksA C4-type zinc finger protein [Bacillus sp. EB600]|jgi:DnaK suppressor protein|uniref:TraR/DksA C4-type zinc finger protein n=1 Tax=Bacillus sp. EB600 TaxID=2806345 RepID=UPI00210C9848|nr:TraR/DksA C4-type zinc finger protein [Bacillus sp. EB600]MCQ6282617.1 TraR/DksA C4-type zinc finger protein [Bacillus sp. EB600]